MLALTLNIGPLNDQVNQYMMDNLVDFSHRPHEIICAYLNRVPLEILASPELRSMIRLYLSPEIYQFTGLYLSHITAAQTLGVSDMILIQLNPEQQTPYEDLP